MADKIGIHDSEVHELKLGGSFSKDNSVAFHSIRYDFKPASVDTSRASNVAVGKGASVTVEVPHVEGSGTSHTVFKGSKRPCQKECVLIIDQATGEITLERLASDIRLKKTRVSSLGSPKSHNMQTDSVEDPVATSKRKQRKKRTKKEETNPEEKENSENEKSELKSPEKTSRRRKQRRKKKKSENLAPSPKTIDLSTEIESPDFQEQSHDLVAFARQSKELLESFFVSHNDDRKRRPQLRFNYDMNDMQREHPEVHQKIKQRLKFSDDQLLPLVCFISGNYSKQLLDTRSMTGEVQRLEDAMDYIIKLYLAQGD